MDSSSKSPGSEPAQPSRSPSAIPLGTQAMKPSALTTKPAQASILVIDETAGPRESFKVIFETDYALTLVDSAAAALEAAARTDFAVAIVDLGLARSPSIEIIRQLRALHPATEVIVMSATGDAVELQAALEAGACDSLNKPFGVVAMQAAVARAVQRRGILKELWQHQDEARLLRHKVVECAQNEQSLRAECEIYACILHDLRNPISVISSLASIMEHDVLGKPFLRGSEVQSLHKNLRQVHAQIQRCSEVAERYLGLMRKRSASKASTQVNPILRDLHKLLSHHTSAQANSLHVGCLEHDVTASINCTDLLQILVNLATNAMECSTASHSVEIRASVLAQASHLESFAGAQEHVLLRSEHFAADLSLVAISVIDDGPGIAPGVLRSIFEPYVTTKGRGKGIGLGLAIVQRLVEEAGGALLVSSTLGRGSSFTLFLPVGETGGSPHVA